MPSLRAQRLNGGRPIIDRDLLLAAGADAQAAGNINGPSVIELPGWIPPARRADPAARFYCYFAHHSGRSIRLAWAADPTGPWTPWRLAEGATATAGVFDLGPPAARAGRPSLELGAGLTLEGHVGSPEALLDPQHQRVLLLLHGPIARDGSGIGQHSLVATSADGLDFHRLASHRGDGHGLRPALLGRPYMRLFWLRERLYAAYVGGCFAVADGIDRASWAADPEAAWTGPAARAGGVCWRHVEGPLHRWHRERGGMRSKLVAVGAPRHLAVAVSGDRLELFSSNYDARPERIVRRVLDTSAGPDPESWRLLAVDEELLRPELAWEGADVLEPDGSIAASTDGAATGVHQLRDPAILAHGGCRYLYYCGRGEEAIGVAEILPAD